MLISGQLTETQDTTRPDFVQPEVWFRLAKKQKQSPVFHTSFMSVP